MSPTDPRLSPARHAPAVLGCAVVLMAAGAGIGASTALTPAAAEPARAAPVAPALRPALPFIAEAPPAATVRAPQPAVREETHVAAGELDGSLYDSALKAGASPTLVTQVSKLFAKTLDFARDIRPGDRFRLVFERKVDGAGRTVETGDLLYAEVGAKGRTTRFYRFDHDGKTDFLDEVGQRLRALLLRTPVENARITSSFGMRLHPLLGFNRLHPGVDFGAPVGTPVYAAGDGVVEEAAWAGGYGRWLKLKHDHGFETGYGHLSRYAPGVRPGVRVGQGEVVAYVGSTGLSTGPHLHYEVMREGRKVDPSSLKIPQEAVMDEATVAAFQAQKARINRLLGDAPLTTASAGGAFMRSAAPRS